MKRFILIRQHIIKLHALVYIAVLAWSTSSFAAGKDDIGTAAMQFLKLGLGPRGLALGEAFSAVADDVSSIYWNPAGLRQIDMMAIQTGYDLLLESIAYGHLLYGVPVSQKLSFGAGISHLMQPSLSEYDEFGNPLGSIALSDTAGLMTVSAGSSALSWGITAKFASSRIGSASANAAAGDIGIMLSGERLKLGLVCQHIGSSVSFKEASEPLPLTMRAGIAAVMLDQQNALIAADVIIPNDNQPVIAVGLEHIVELPEQRKAVFRAGYNSRARELKETAGCAVGLGVSDQKYSIDYAWIPFGALGSTHRLSITIYMSREWDNDRPVLRHKKKHTFRPSNKKSKSPHESPRPRKHTLKVLDD